MIFKHAISTVVVGRTGHAVGVSPAMPASLGVPRGEHREE